jgi:hypothetical protein
MLLAAVGLFTIAVAVAVVVALLLFSMGLTT